MSDAVELRNISRRFGKLMALDQVSLRFAQGSIHGLLGENGAGKSTLMNVLYGLLQPDGGEILLEGKRARISSPQAALSQGIGMVHQHFMLAGAMTVLDNILLGDRRAGRWLDRSTAAKTILKLSSRLGLPVRPAARIDDLSVGEQQRVEILKALYREVRVLILDEPTAVLTPAEIDQLFTAVERLAADGKTIIFISHKLGEIKRICNEVTVLRRGRIVFGGRVSEVSTREISRQMVGFDIEATRLDRKEGSAPRDARALLSINAVSTPGLRDVSLRISAGEILGVAGVDGNGQQQLAEVIIGLCDVAKGIVNFDSHDITTSSSMERFNLGLAHIPNDRGREGLIGAMSITENLALKHAPRRMGILKWPKVQRTARELMAAFDIRATSPSTRVRQLSGGNQQKVLLARELAIRAPRLVVAMNPVRGLDVAATQFVYQQLLAVRANGGAVLLISSELDELLALCDRIGVLLNGRFTMSDFPRDGAAEIGRMMTGTADSVGAA
jgi:ABC-type uncharacterized transport system ATPase subunit